MKYLIAFLFTLTSISIINAQSPVGHLLDSLPSNFSYQVTTDSFAKMDFNTSTSPIAYFQGKMTIGCYKPVEVQPSFSIEIGHLFLFEDIEEFNFFINEDKVVIRWKFRFNWKNDTYSEIEELVYQTWEGEQIKSEHFFFDPSQMIPKNK